MLGTKRLASRRRGRDQPVIAAPPQAASAPPVVAKPQSAPVFFSPSSLGERKDVCGLLREHTERHPLKDGEVPPVLTERRYGKQFLIYRVDAETIVVVKWVRPDPTRCTRYVIDLKSFETCVADEWVDGGGVGVNVRNVDRAFMAASNPYDLADLRAAATCSPSR